MDKKHNNLAQPETDGLVRSQDHKKPSLQEKDHQGIKLASKK